MAAQDKGRILELLGSGLSVGVVASTVGCDQSYVSQLMSLDEFSSKVVELRSKSLLAATKRDRAIDEIEDDLIQNLGEIVSRREIYKPREILAAFAVLNKAQRRGTAATDSLTINNTVVQLLLPDAITKEFTKNLQGEVIEVEGKSMQTMPAQSLLKHLASTKGAVHGEAYERIGRFISPVIEVIDNDKPKDGT